MQATPTPINGPCGACRRYRWCNGDGPARATIAFLGEGPGEVEDRRRRPFVGPSGMELDYQYLPLSGLSRPDVYVTNAIKCRQGRKGGDDPDPHEVLTCARHHLPGELARVQPKLIVTLGAVALRLFGNHSLEMEHGRPLYNQKFAQWEGMVFPIYHPAAGLRQSEFMIHLQEDFKALHSFRHGKLILPVDQFPRPHYRALHTPDDLRAVLQEERDRWGGDFRGLEVGIDTETLELPNGEKIIWCLTFSMRAGTGYLIRSDNPEVLRVFRAFLRSISPLVLYHNYLFDAPVLRQVDIVTPRWIDTMQEAFQCCHLPQALKVLAYRYLGMEMEEYEDLVMPYGIAEAIGYLHSVSKNIVPEFVEALPWKHKTLRCSGGKKYGGKHESTGITFMEPLTVNCPVCGKPKLSGNMERDKQGKQFIWDRARKILEDVMEEGANPLARWKLIPMEERAVAEALVGSMPMPGIDKVPFEEAVHYACRDADATVRAKAVVRRAARALGRRVG